MVLVKLIDPQSPVSMPTVPVANVEMAIPRYDVNSG